MEVKSCWLVILPYKAFYMVGPPCTKEEAEHHARSIWFNAYCE